LLIFGKLPTADQLANLQKRINSKRSLPEILKNILEQLSKESNAMDVMRTISSVMGILEP